jgi:hypothetical protein
MAYKTANVSVSSRSISVMALVLLLGFLATSASAGTVGYLYVGDADTTATTEASVNLPINAQTISDAIVEEHSLFEMSMSNTFATTGDIIEIGVTTDLGLNGDSKPHWFVYSWINGVGQGYDSHSHFVSQIGNFWTQSLTTGGGTVEQVKFQYNAPNWELYLNGSAAGYFPGSEWSGAFTSSLVTQVFGEVYQDGTFYPSLDGTVSGYSSSSGGHLFPNLVDAPYSQSNASQTGFTASGPVGDFNRNGQIDAADILAMEKAITNLPAYQTASGLTKSQLLAIGDINGDGKFTNADIQTLLKSLKSGGGTSDPVPEPATFILMGLGGIAVSIAAGRRSRETS